MRLQLYFSVDGYVAVFVSIWQKFLADFKGFALVEKN